MKSVSLIMMLLIGITMSLMAQTSNWTFTGPSNFPTNISGQINGIGRVTQLKFDPNNNNTMFACSASGGLWKSTNAGTTWAQLGTDQLPPMNLASVCIDYTNSDIIYLGTGDPNYYSTDIGVWKTVDGGLNWAQSTNGMAFNMPLEILMDSADHLKLLAATNTAIYKTIDGGANWVAKTGSFQFTDMKWKPESGSSIVYASSMNKFFRSTDRGDTWTEITSGFAGLLADGTRIAVSANDPAVVYVATVNDEGTIFKSVDSGLNFTIQYHDPTWSLTGYDSTGGGQGNYNFCLEANPDNVNQLFLGSHNIMRSNDGGVNWSKLTNWWQTVHTDMHDYIFKPGNSSQLYQANDGGVWLTGDAGIGWSQKSDGLGATENYHAATSPLYAGLISTGTQDNGELIYIDNSWKTNRGGDWGTKMIMDYSTQKFVYYFDDLERRALPSGGGSAYNLPTPITTASIKHVFSPDDQNLGYVSGINVWQCKNLVEGSPVWTQIGTGTSTIRAMAVSRNHPNIFAYAYSNKFNITHDALSATPTFTTTTLPISMSSGDIAISSVDTNLIFIIEGVKIYKSTDGGASFVDITGAVANGPFKIFLDDYSGDVGLYVATLAGVYYRNNTMTNWINYSGALPTIASINDIMYFNDGGVDARIYVSYYGRGVWETDLENPHTCATPVIASTTFSGANVLVNWNNTGAVEYNLQYREVGTVPWSNMTVTTNTASISSYSGCTMYEVRVRGECGVDSSLWSNKSTFNTPSNPLNNDFDNHQDIGSVGAAGSVCYDALNQRYTVFASGNDIWDKSDQFHFLYKKIVGDVTISARVKHIGNIYGWAKGGVMIRETLAPDSKQSMCVLTPGNGFANQWRVNTNDWSDNVNLPGTEPGWVKMERIGSVLNAYYSTDGNVWNLFNTANITMNDTVYVGLANCSHIDSTINDAVFDHIIINGVALSTTNMSSSASPFTLYPNPVTDELNIAFNNLPEQSFEIIMYDAAGNAVLHNTRAGKKSTQSINTSSLSSGVYFVEIRGDKKYFSKFVKK